MKFDAYTARNLVMFYLAPAMMDAMKRENDSRTVMASLLTIEQLDHGHMYGVLDEQFYGTPEAPARQFVLVYCKKLDNEQPDGEHWEVQLEFLFGHQPASVVIGDMTDFEKVVSFATLHRFSPKAGAFHVAASAAKCILNFLVRGEVPDLTPVTDQSTEEVPS